MKNLNSKWQEADESFFRKMVITVFAYNASYALVYFLLEARLSALILFVTGSIYTPVILLLEKSGHKNMARLSLCWSALIYIYATPFGIRLGMSTDYYYLVALMLPALLFDPAQKGNIIFGMIICPLVWAFQTWGPLPEFSSYWSPASFPVELFNKVNFLGATLLVTLFLTYFITRFLRVNAELLKTSEHQNHILEGAGLGSWDWDLTTGVILYDRRWCKMLGLDLPSASANFSTWESRLHPIDRIKATAEIRSYLAGETTLYESINRMLHADGSWVWILSRGRVSERDPSGKPLRFTGTHFEITQYKEIEELSSNLQKMAKIGGWELDPSTETTKWTDETYRIHGLPVGRPTNTIGGISFFLPGDQSKIRDQISRCIQGDPYRDTYEFIDANGLQKWVEVMGEPVFDSHGKVLKLRGTIQDITEKKRTQEEFKKTSKELEQFFNLAPDLLCIGGMDGWFKKTNPAFTTLLGYSPEELSAEPFLKFIHPDDVNFTAAKTENLVLGIPTVNFENRYRCRDGSYKTLSWSASPDLPTGLFYAAARDITKIRDSEERLAEAQRVARIGSWSLEVATKNIRWSNQMYELFQKDIASGPPSLEGYHSTIHPDDQAHWKETLENCITNRVPFRIRFKTMFSDKFLWIEAIGSPRLDSQGVVVEISGTCQDISELVLAEDLSKFERAKSVQSAKLASLGEMSAGIAHEINNPLTIISGNIAILGKYANDPERLKAKTDILQRAVERISKIVNGLKKFSRTSDKNKHRPHALAEIAKEAVFLSEFKAKRSSVTVEFDPQSDSEIFCDEIEIEQVLINLINNGIDAVINLEERWVSVKLFEKKDKIILQVRDSGNGIDPKIQKRLFEPFFTTKSVGEGTGLGLSIVRGILDEHNATIEILRNEPNTCFEIRFEKVRTDS